MLHSAEIRWFLPEAEMGAFDTLFPKSPPGDAMNWLETRTDVYRVVPGADIIGLKLRGHGRLELKALQAPLEPFPWTIPGSPAIEAILGQTDLWIKWDLSEGHGGKLMPTAREIPVRKVRWTRKWSADGHGLKAIPAHRPQPAPDSGCNVERTELTIGHERWLSLGFEAFGDPVRSILAETVALIMDTATPAEITRLASARSESYPVWLDAHVRRIGH